MPYYELYPSLDRDNDCGAVFRHFTRRHLTTRARLRWGEVQLNARDGIPGGIRRYLGYGNRRREGRRWVGGTMQVKACPHARDYRTVAGVTYLGDRQGWFVFKPTLRTVHRLRFIVLSKVLWSRGSFLRSPADTWRRKRARDQALFMYVWASCNIIILYKLGWLDSCSRP